MIRSFFLIPFLGCWLKKVGWGGGGCLVFALLIKLICINLMDDKVTWVCMQPKFVDT